ncbi:MAG: polysaccharide deacetylase family protein, partial [Bacteroidota bacterium]
MADWYIPPLAFLVRSVRWTTGSSDVWLTFDDGPHPDATPAVLKVLQEEKARACFFLLGKHVERHPTLVRRMCEEGHGVANHSFFHQPVWFRKREDVAHELSRTNDVIAAAGGSKPTMFRPPFGRFDLGTPRVARAAGLETVLFG